MGSLMWTLRPIYAVALYGKLIRYLVRFSYFLDAANTPVLRTSSCVVSRSTANTGSADESSCGRSFNREHRSCVYQSYGRMFANSPHLSG